MQTAAKGFDPHVTGSNFSVHQTLIELCSPSLIVQLWCHSVHAYHYIHLKMETSLIKAYCTLPCWVFKRCSCSTQVLSWCWRIKTEFPGKNYFLVVFKECPSECNVDHPEWNCFKCLVERLEAQIKIGCPIFRGKKSRQSSQKPEKEKPWKSEPGTSAVSKQINT